MNKFQYFIFLIVISNHFNTNINISCRNNKINSDYYYYYYYYYYLIDLDDKVTNNMNTSYCDNLPEKPSSRTSIFCTRCLYQKDVMTSCINNCLTLRKSYLKILPIK
jgi:hypothetical protein